MKSRSTSQQKQHEPPTALLSARNPAELCWEAQQVQLAIARRAYELFESRGWEHGHDWEDWFRAESELLRPVSVSLSESEDRISLRANVFGFNEHEIRVSVEPRRILILGKKKETAKEPARGKIEHIDWSPDQILQVVNLEREIEPEGAVVELQTGVLKFELPKAAPSKIETAAAA
jgi:HSP20 family protein